MKTFLWKKQTIIYTKYYLWSITYKYFINTKFGITVIHKQYIIGKVSNKITMTTNVCDIRGGKKLIKFGPVK